MSYLIALAFYASVYTIVVLTVWPKTTTAERYVNGLVLGCAAIILVMAIFDDSTAFECAR